MSRTLLLAVLAVIAAPAVAQSGEALVAKYNCGMCHTKQGNSMVPGWDGIAAKFAGNKDAVATITATIKKGHPGGAVSMPATAMSDADAKAIADYILAMKK